MSLFEQGHYPPKNKGANVSHKKQRSKRFDSTKDDMHLLGQLYISLQVREGNADILFEVENTDVPPSLSNHGNLRSGQKSDLVSFLETSDFDEADVKCIDVAPPLNLPLEGHLLMLQHIYSHQS